jgi:Animal haem peroxidase
MATRCQPTTPLPLSCEQCFLVCWVFWPAVGDQTHDPLRVNNPDSPTHTAGTTFMGQFLDHDMTFDTTSRLGVPTRPVATPNTRIPTLDLDSVYGNGPAGSPLLYDPNDKVKFRIESGCLFEDLPRDANDMAIIAEPRNDENLIIAGLHAAFLLAHNNAVELVRAQYSSTSDDEAFRQARELMRRHYHHHTGPISAGIADSHSLA